MSIALTTKEKVKTQLGISGTTHDALIDELIKKLSKRVETYCGRSFERATHTEYFDTDAGDRLVFLKNTPVTSLTSVSYRQGNFGNPTYVAFNSNDYLLKENQTIVFNLFLPDAYQFVQAVYVGGYLIDFDNETDVSLHTLPDDITQAMTELVARVFEQRKSDGILSETTEGQSVTFKDQTTNKRMHELFGAYRHINI